MKDIKEWVTLQGGDVPVVEVSQMVLLDAMNPGSPRVLRCSAS
jgi:hypothetical protein